MSWFKKKRRAAPLWITRIAPDWSLESYLKWEELLLEACSHVGIAWSEKDIQKGAGYINGVEVSLDHIAETCVGQGNEQWSTIFAMELALLSEQMGTDKDVVDRTNWVELSITIWEQMLPISRGMNYEDPLSEYLETTGSGQMNGGGTQLGTNREIECIDIGLFVEDSEETIDNIMRILCEHGIPKNSLLVITRDCEQFERRFGATEGICLTLPSIISASEVDNLITQIEASIPDGQLDFRGAQVVRDSELQLQFYGLDADKLWNAISPSLKASSVCRGARVVIRCGHPDNKPRHFKLHESTIE